MLDLMRRLPHFDPARGAQRSTFIARIVDHCVATLIESQKAGMRDYRQRAISIDAEPAEFDELTVDGEEQLGRKLDLTKVLREMSENDRALCKRLMHQTVSQIARETSTPRTTIHDARARIRRRFERAGLREYA
jgi:RNA polymerase sigma-70 factor (ECF subfamily)